MTKALAPRIQDAEGNWTALTPELAKKLVAAIRAGQWPIDAAFSCGITPATLKRCLEKGQRGIEPYAAFAAEFLKAESDHAADVMGTVEQVRKGEADPMTANSQLHAAKFILETRYRWLWGGNTLSAAAFVEQMLATDADEKKQKALEALKNLPAEEKKKLRDAGFVLP